MAEGSEWQSKIRFLKYNVNGSANDQSTNEVDDVCRLISSTIPNATKIKCIGVWGNKLKADGFLRYCCCCCYKKAEGVLKHHFIEVEIESGEFFTIEKTPQVILLQYCPRPSSTSIPVVRTMRDQKRRVPLTVELEKVVRDDEQPKNVCIEDVIRWIGSDGQLNDPYHVTNSNCWQFTNVVWGELSEKAYPPPSRFNEAIEKIGGTNTRDPIPVSPIVGPPITVPQ